MVVGEELFLQMCAFLIILREQAGAHTGPEERLAKKPGNQPVL